MIRFSAALVVVAIGVLIAGVAASSLPFVYVAIGVSAVALLVLAAGVVLKRDGLFTEEAQSSAEAQPVVAAQSAAADGVSAGGVSVGGASQPRVAAGVGGSVSGSTLPGDTAFPGSTAYPGDTGFGDWASTRYAQQAPVQQAHDGTPGRAGAVSPTAWPPSAPSVPAAGDVPSGTPSPIPPASFRRPAAPPTRADPVLPWADSLPTRVDIGGTPRTPTGDAGSPSSGSSAGPPSNGLLPGGKFAWRDITRDDSAGDGPRAGDRDSGERDGGEPGFGATATTASIAPPASAVTPSWLDDVDDASEASPSADGPSAPAGEADDLPGSGNAGYDWLSVDDDDAPTGEAAPDHAAASRVTSHAEAAANDTGAAADAVGTDNDIDLDATAALDIQPGLDADTNVDPDADASVDADADPSADAEPAWADLAATAALDIQPGLDADTNADPDADADLHADAARDVDVPGASDEDDLAPTGPAVAETAVAETASTELASGTGQVTVVPGVPRYHDGDCILIRFMADEDVQRMTVPEAEKAGCTPCRACQDED